MEELRRIFDTIVLCLRRKHIVKDIRRIILLRWITNEFKERFLGNCVGSTFTCLLCIVTKFNFKHEVMALINSTYDQKPNDHVCLLTRAGTDFILGAGILNRVEIPINHPTENLGILTKSLCVQVVTMYISDKILIDEFSTEAYIKIDENLRSLLFANEPGVEIGRLMTTKTLFACLNHCMFHVSPVRFISDELVKQLEAIRKRIAYGLL